MLVRSVAASLAVLMLVFALGCGNQMGDLRVEYEKGEPLTVGQARVDGDYALYAWNSVTPRAIYPLRKGDRLGFERTPGGQIRAVAGSNPSVILDADTQEAYWRWTGEAR